MVKLHILAVAYNLELEDLQYRADGRVEWVCKHGVGHTIYSPSKKPVYYIHCCDGCCEHMFKDITKEVETRLETKTKTKTKMKINKSQALGILARAMIDLNQQQQLDPDTVEQLKYIGERV